MIPLHDWTDRAGWEGVHLFWMTELARWLKANLPAGYRAFIGASPLLAVDFPNVKPDVPVKTDPHRNGPSGSVTTLESVQPDLEVVVTDLREDQSVMVEQAGRLVAVIELVSPRNKDRPTARTHHGTRYLSYLNNGVHLLLVDVHPRPRDFSFGAMIAESLKIDCTSIPHAPSD